MIGETGQADGIDRVGIAKPREVDQRQSAPDEALRVIGGCGLEILPAASGLFPVAAPAGDLGARPKQIGMVRKSAEPLRHRGIRARQVMVDRRGRRGSDEAEGQTRTAFAERDPLPAGLGRVPPRLGRNRRDDQRRIQGGRIQRCRIQRCLIQRRGARRGAQAAFAMPRSTYCRMPPWR